MTTQAQEEAVSYGRRLTGLAGATPDGTAVVFVTVDGDEHGITWRELDRRSNRVARALAARGVGQGDMVVIALPNSLEHVVIAFGAWKAGACALPLRWDLPEWERARVLAVARPAVVVGAWTEYDGAPVVAPELLEGAAVSDEPVPDRVPDVARAIATSGSTGTPKVICITGSGMFTLKNRENDLGNVMAHRADQKQLIPAPLYHTNGSALAFNALLRGQTVVLMQRFVADLTLRLIEKYRINTLTATTIMLQRMARSPEWDRCDISSIESLLHGAAPLPQWLARVWIDRIGPERFFVAYGSSENAGATMARGDDWLAHPGTVGRTVNTELRIVGEDGRELPVGEVGMIQMRRPGQTAPTFSYLGDVPTGTGPDFFTFFGDLGRVDADGYLYLADRRADMIISGGANVYPAEVEAALTEHPGVADAVVVGLPDEEWGERVHAVVEPADPAAPPSPDELRAHCRERLAAYKVPKAVELVTALPRTAAGKIRRADVARARGAHSTGTG